jgi:hypothetical protein
MDDSFAEYIGYLVFFIFFILPRILKALAGKKGGKSKAPAKTPTLEDILAGQTVQQAEPSYSAAELKAYQESVQALAGDRDALVAEAADLMQTAKSRGGGVLKMKGITEDALIPYLNRLEKRITRLNANIDEPNESEVHQIRAVLSRLSTISSLLVQMTEQRLKPDRSDILGVLDTACKEALVPFRIHAGRMNLNFPTRYVLSVMDDAGADFAHLLEGSRIAVAVVDRRQADLPRAWANVVSDVGMDVCYSSQGLLKRLKSDLGALAAPVSAIQYQNPRMLIGALLGGWLPRIFGDVVAALYLGPGCAFGFTLSSEGDEPLTAEIKVGQKLKAPAHVRVFAASRALSHIGFQKEAREIWENWQRQQGNPSTIALKDASGKTAKIPVAPVLEVIARVVTYLVTDPIPLLGNYPLAHIPSLGCDARIMARITELIPYLLEGRPRNAPSRVIIGAALLAQERSPTMERRIGKAALLSIAGKGEVVSAPSISGRTAAPAILDVAHLPGLAMEAMAAGAALAPRRFGRPRR